MNTPVRLLAALLCGAAPAALAGSWGVSPITLEFAPSTKTGSIVVSNDDAAPLNLQLQLMSWTQDAQGKDVYAESEDLVFFPRIVTIKPRDSRVVRVGTKRPAGATERTYRLFLEEIGSDPKAKGTAIAVKLRFGVPIFVAPTQPALAGALDPVRLRRGELSVTVRNTGNQRFRFEKLVAQAGSVTLGEADGWYLLASAQREYRIKLDPAACASAGKVAAVVAAEGLELRRELAASPTLCRP